MRACLAHYRAEIGIAGIIALRCSKERHMTFSAFFHDLAYRIGFRENLILDFVDKHVQSGLWIVTLIVEERRKHHIYELDAGLCIRRIRADNNDLIGASEEIVP